MGERGGGGVGRVEGQGGQQHIRLQRLHRRHVLLIILHCTCFPRHLLPLLLLLVLSPCSGHFDDQLRLFLLLPPRPLAHDPLHLHFDAAGGLSNVEAALRVGVAPVVQQQR